MRLLPLLVLLVAAPLAAQSASGTYITAEPSASSRTPEFLAQLPTERYGVEWGMTRGDVVAVRGRTPDADEPEGITYLGRSGGQTIYIFEADATGADRLTAVVDVSPGMVHLRDALSEADQYKAAFIRRYGAPVIEDAPRPGTAGDAFPMIDTVWEPGREIRSVELTVDHVETRAADGTPAVAHLFYVRTVGPPADIR